MIQGIPGSPASTSTRWTPRVRRLSIGTPCSLWAIRRTRPPCLDQISHARIPMGCSERLAGPSLRTRDGSHRERAEDQAARAPSVEVDFLTFEELESRGGASGALVFGARGQGLQG